MSRGHLAGRGRPRLALALVAATSAALALAVAAEAKTGGGRGGIKLAKVGSFQSPVYVDAAPGSRALYVVEQPGRIMVLPKGKGKGRTFLDIRGKVTFGGEQGLLSIAFPPDHRRSGLFYVYYVTSGGDLAIEEYRRAGAKRRRARRPPRHLPACTRPACRRASPAGNRCGHRAAPPPSAPASVR